MQGGHGPSRFSARSVQYIRLADEALLLVQISRLVGGAKRDDSAVRISCTWELFYSIQGHGLHLLKLKLASQPIIRILLQSSSYGLVPPTVIGSLVAAKHDGLVGEPYY